MSPARIPVLARRRTTTRSIVATLLSGALTLAAATLVLGCSGGTAMTSTTGGATPMATMAATHAATPASASGDSTDGMAHDMTTAQLDTAWSERPAFVRINGAATSEAYAFALMNPTPLESMPCYCGCVAMDHRSNLDCFFKPQNKTANGLTFEEHASFCQICVDTALLTKHRLAEGASLAEIRHEVDTTIGNNGVEGTHTALPPSA
jgi:hypothetical protein